MDYQELRFVYSHTGFLKNIYKSKKTNRYYALQWDNGYSQYPHFYSATKDGEADCPIKKEAIQYFIFPEGHEHYGEILKESVRAELLLKSLKEKKENE